MNGKMFYLLSGMAAVIVIGVMLWRNTPYQRAVRFLNKAAALASVVEEDSEIARRMKGRTDEYRAFGGQLDSLIDIVSFGILPAVFLLSYGEFSPWFLPGAFVIVTSSAIRLSYFNVFGLIDDSTYMGLALDNNVIILSFVFLFDGFFSQTVFSAILYSLCMIMAAFNLAPVRTPKFSGKWIYGLTVYTLGVTVIYGWILWSKNQ